MGASEPQVLTAQLTLTPALLEQLHRDEGSLDVAQAYVIDSIEMAQEANKELREIKARIDQVERAKDGFTLPARQIIDHANAIFDRALARLRQAEKTIKDRLIAFQNEQQRLADEARRRREAEERAARARAEAEAAAARARAEEEARQKREAAAAEAKRLADAQAAGDARAAREAAERQAKLEQQAAHAEAAGEARAMELQLAAAPANEPEPAPVKIDGLVVRNTWAAALAEGVPTDESAVPLIIAAIAGVPPEKFARPELRALLKIEWPKAHQLAKSLEKDMNVPGLQAVRKQSAASRAAKAA